jgi:hypothetical protein
MSALLAVNWEWEIRGTLIVIIAVTVLPGSIYLILGTNLGARLGFLVALTALTGWMFLLGAVWWSYGKGLLGTDPTWQPVAGKTIVREVDKLSETGVIRTTVPATADHAADALNASGELQKDGWKKLNPAAPAFQQAQSSASVLMDESKALAAGEFTVVNVFDKGGQRGPKIGWFDYFAFKHDPHFAVVEVAPLVPQRSEPGRAPARPIIDTARSHEYIYMVRDLGNRRRPAGIITVVSLTMFLLLCWLLHRRDRFVTANRSAKALPAKA